MATQIKRIVVYYKSVPQSLSSYVARNKRLTLTKDGSTMLSGVTCAKLIITVEIKNDHTDKEEILKISNLLDSLQRNNQIFAYESL